MIDPHLHADVAQAEGCRLKAYHDSLGFWTIGYGHLLTPIDHDWGGLTCTQDQAESWLNEDLDIAATEAQPLPEMSKLNACRQNAVIELVFNLGLAKWEKFVRTRQALQDQQWAAAATNLLQSRWAAQVGFQRSHRISNYFLTGIYP